MIYLKRSETPLGAVTLMSDGVNLTGLWFDGQKYDRETFYAEKERDCVEEAAQLPIFLETEAYLRTYFKSTAAQGSSWHGAANQESVASCQGLPCAVPLKPSGSPFRHIIWTMLTEIPFGSLVTYGTLAKAAAKSGGKELLSAQAVGGAVGHNPISILIPCHRVVGSDGSLTGYAGGIDKKIKLLEIEGHHIYERRGRYFVSGF